MRHSFHVWAIAFIFCYWSQIICDAPAWLTCVGCIAIGVVIALNEQSFRDLFGGKQKPK